MALLDSLRMTRHRDDVAARVASASVTASAFDPSTYPYATPFGSSDLHRMVWSDTFGGDVPSNTRAGAMRVPALARARNLMVATICRLPLVEMEGAARSAVQPSWLSWVPGGSSPQQRLAWTVDDLIFYGWSCWSRVTDPARGMVAGRINQGDWAINDDNRVEVNGSVVDDSDVIVIPGLHEGILSYGVDAIQDARTLHRIVRQRLVNPTPSLELHQTDGPPLSDAEIDALIGRWATARNGQNGGVAFTSRHIEAKEMNAGGEQLLIEARNAAALDLARIVGVSGSRIDATVDKASLTYETTTGRNQELVDFDLALYLTPVAARLSLDDVTPPGRRIVFDLADLTGPTPAATGPTLQD